MYAKWASLVLEYGTMRWAVEIQNTTLERRNLSDLLGGLGFTLVDGSQFPLFTSPEIDGCHTADEVFEQGKRLRAAFAVPPPTDPGFVLGSVIDYSSDPPEHYTFTELTPVGRNLRLGWMVSSASPPAWLSDEERERWEREQVEAKYQVKLEAQRARFEPAFRNGKAAKVLELLAIEDPSGGDLFKIYELCEGNPGNRPRFHKQFRISLGEFQRFEDVVHNKTVSGDWARHARDESPKTNNPMSQGEAVSFIQRVAYEWLEYIRRA